MTIATHDGIFHADEVMAIAILKTAYCDVDIQIIRTRNPELLATADIRVDVGGKYNPGTGDYDHHHDRTLPASCNLVWETHMDLLCESGDQQEYVRRTLLDPISGLDCDFTGYSKENPIGPYKTIGQAIMDFNRDPSNTDEQLLQFCKAIEFATVVLQNSLYVGLQHSKHIKTIETASSIGEFGLLLDSAIPYNELRDKLSRKLLVYPDPVSGWCVVSLDTEKFNLSSAEKYWGAIFAHKAGFFAKFNTREEAIACAENKSELRSQEIDQWAHCFNDGNGARKF